MLKMRNKLKKNMGMTLIEVILAIAVLGIITAPLLVVFTNSAGVILKTRDRIELNAAIRIAKENTVNSEKYGISIAEYDNSAKTTKLNELAIGSTATNLEIRDNKNVLNEKYVFDAERKLNYGAIADFENTCEFIITIKTVKGKAVEKLRIYINNIINIKP